VGMEAFKPIHRKSHLARAKLAIILMIQGSEIMAQNALEQWHPVLTSSRTGFVEITTGNGSDSRPFVVVAEGTGKLISWPHDSPARQTVSTFRNRFRSVTYGKGRFIAVGLDGPIVTSTNALDWEVVRATGSGLTRVVFGNNIFLALGQNGLLRSTNGLHWTTPARPAPWSFPNLYFARDMFVLTASPGTNLLSKDGLVWSAASSGTFENLYTLGYGNGTFVAIAIRNELLTSPDALTWISRGRLDVTRPSNIAVGNGYLVTVGANARAYSGNGQSWTIAPSGVTEGAVTFANGKFLACGYEHVHQSEEIISLEMKGTRSLSIAGVANRSYQIDTANQLLRTNTAWTARHAFVMGESPYQWQDSQTPAEAFRFYRVRPVPTTNQEALPPKVISIQPTNGREGVSDRPTIEARIQDGDTATVLSASLRIDGNLVTANFQRAGKISIISWIPALQFEPGSAHTVQLTFNDDAIPPVTRTADWSFRVSFNPLVFSSNTLFIEAEDFNFGKGQWIQDKPIGMTGPYPGGEYQGRGSGLNQAACGGSDFGVDYNEVGADNQEPSYRPFTAVEAGKRNGLAGFNRGAFDVSVNHVLGWNNQGEWLNYTRRFPEPARDYKVYSRIASGDPGAQRNHQLSLITSDRTHCNQTELVLGTFSGPWTGGWDVWPDQGTSADALVPLRDGSGAEISIRLGGEVTLRYTFLSGAGDPDYMAFLPVVP
jgi:hypothetical protein